MRRLQTSTQRDEQGLRGLRERQAAVPAPADDEITGRHEGEELRRMRSRRPTEERIERLEDKHDELAAAVNGIAVSNGTINGQLKTLLDLAAAAAVERESRAKADRDERADRRKYIVPIITALGIAVAAIAVAIAGHT